jgi:hypothetical protein
MNVTWALGAAFIMGLALAKLAHCITRLFPVSSLPMSEEPLVLGAPQAPLTINVGERHQWLRPH